ncbi:MAG: hypothetical protein MK110_03875 [Fuerstiella sp.]|nr:hypothetical protein [Fuerstiella sp.]
MSSDPLVQTGTSVAQALTNYSGIMRNTNRERADLRANAASLKRLFPTILCLLPTVFMFLPGPAVIPMSDFFRSTAGELLKEYDNALDSPEQGPSLVEPQ